VGQAWDTDGTEQIGAKKAAIFTAAFLLMVLEN